MHTENKPIHIYIVIIMYNFVNELQHKGQEANTATYNDGTLLNNVLFDFMLATFL